MSTHLHFISVPVSHGGPAATELNQFLARHHVVGLEKQLVQEAGCWVWAVCITWRQGPEKTPAKGHRRVDYREVLSHGDFALFSKLRELRKLLADEASVPVYNIFNNAQLAAMVQKPVRSLAEMGTLEGVGERRLKEYGERFLKLLSEGVTPQGDDGEA